MDNLSFKIENLCISYANKKIFQNLNLDIKKNSITAICGPSGIGKTSLLFALNMMIKEFENATFSGKISYFEDGKEFDITKFKDKDLPDYRKKVVYVSQHPDILPFSIFENLYFALKLQNISKENAKDLIIESLKKVHLYEEIKDRLDDSAILLSGGQQQRLILARALVLKPKVLLLDEPTSSLNEELAIKIENMLLELKKNTTIVIISHFKSQILNIADYSFEIK